MKTKIAVFFAFVLASVAFYFSGLGSSTSANIAFSFFIGLLPMAYGYAAFRFFGFRNFQGKSILLLTAGVSLWVLGDVFWWMLTGGIGQVSAADFIYVLGYFILGTGFLFQIFVMDDAKKGFSKAAAVLLFAVVTAFAYFKFFPVFWDESLAFSENIVASAYTLGDFVLVLVALLISFFAISGSYSRGWLIMALATLLTFMGDVQYALNYSEYSGGGLWDYWYYSGYLMYALGFAVIQNSAQATMRKTVINDKKKNKN
jgi:hypothetical protein